MRRVFGDHWKAPSSAPAPIAHGAARGGRGQAHGVRLPRLRSGARGGLGLVTTLAIVACAAAPAPVSTESPDETAAPTAAPSAPAETALSTAETGPVAGVPCSLGVPLNLGPELNAPGFDGGPTPSSDGLRLYFVSDRSGSQGGDIWVSERPAADGAFGSPENLGPGVNGDGNEGAPSLSRDELLIVFDRDDGGIWAATRPAIDAPFGDAERLAGSVNIPFAGFPALSADGLTLHFASQREGGQGGMDLWRASREATGDPFGAVENLGSSVNGPLDDAMATVSANDLRIVFASRREGGMGDWDLWMADRPDVESDFGSPVNLGPDVNTEGFEGRPHLSSDGAVLMFMSDRPGGQGAVDLWEVTIDCSTG
jgi:hypothetical protein